MRQSQLFTRTKKEPPKDATTISHKLLAQADFIDQLMSGVYSFLPLGWRVHRKIERIIREEINRIGGQELFLPVLHPKAIWQETGRWETIDPPLFKYKDRHGKEVALGSTHEEVITDLVRRRIRSYNDLPCYLYQIQDKFRNELRSQGGLLRVREFVMKDLYSFHTDEVDLNRYYREVIGAYRRIFKRCGLEPVIVEASGGTIGGKVTNEFMVIAESGEDRIILCTSCGWATNTEVLTKTAPTRCPSCNHALERASSIEAGHIFSLGTEYSKKMGASYVTREGTRNLIHMGCYGIGLGRLMATVLEVHHDEHGMIWPSEIAPFAVHILMIGSDRIVKKIADRLYRDLQKRNIEVLYDDRDESAGVKFYDADLIGIPWRVLVSEGTVAKDSVEMKRRFEKKARLVKIKNLIDQMSKYQGVNMSKTLTL